MTIGVFTGDAQADHRRFFKVRLIFRRMNEAFKDIAVQLAKILGEGKTGLIFIMLQQQDAEIIVTNIG